MPALDPLPRLEAMRWLEPKELVEVLKAPDRADLIVCGMIQSGAAPLTLWLGDLTTLDVPLSFFRRRENGPRPDFARLAIIDFGHAVQLGKYEASTHAILYEFDPAYRLRVAAKRAPK